MPNDYIAEIFEQPEVLENIARDFRATYGDDMFRVEQLVNSSAIDKIILTGMGGSLHSLYPTLLTLSQKLPVPTALWDTSELVQQTPDLIDERTLLVAVSQSGESAELVRLCRLGKRPRLAISVTNSGTSSLANWADIAVHTNAGPERTASTKTYTGGLASLSLITASLTGSDLDIEAAAIRSAAVAMDRHLPAWRARSVELIAFLGSAGPIAFIGRGGNLATAWMSSLLTAEASKLACPAYPGGQFRHGPLELVREGFACTIFANSHSGAAELDRRLADEVLKLGGRCAWIASSAAKVPSEANRFAVGIPEVASSCDPLLNIVPVQLMQEPLAVARGFEPAQFLNAAKVTTVQ
ncbi:MAG: SIS domain-containing protein [Sphingomicrobium sp.]